MQHEHIYALDDAGIFSCWCGKEMDELDDILKEVKDCRECNLEFYGIVPQLLCNTCSRELGMHEEDIDDA